MLNELHLGVYYFSSDTKIAFSGSKLKKLGVTTIQHWAYVWSIQHGRQGVAWL